jgi:hypothetical protein
VTWQEVDHREDNVDLNARRVTRTFKVATHGRCRFIRLVNIGRNHQGNDILAISAWKLFGSLCD